MEDITYHIIETNNSTNDIERYEFQAFDQYDRIVRDASAVVQRMDYQDFGGAMCKSEWAVMWPTCTKDEAAHFLAIKTAMARQTVLLANV